MVVAMPQPRDRLAVAVVVLVVVRVLAGCGLSPATVDAPEVTGDARGGDAVVVDDAGPRDAPSPPDAPCASCTPLVTRWEHHFGGADFGNDFVGVGVDGAGNTYASGFFVGSIDLGGGTLASAGGSDIVVASFSGDGTHRWSRRFGGAMQDQASGLFVTGGKVYVAANFSGTANFGGGDLTSAGMSDSLILVLDAATGAYVTAYHFGTAGEDDALSVVVDAAGNIELRPVRKGRGGARRGAGRKAVGRRSDPPHRARPEHKKWQAVHVVLRARPDVPRLRRRKVFEAVRRALRTIAGKVAFRVVHLSIQRNHLHFLVEADSGRALSRGMQALDISLARRINRACSRRGKVFAHRFHATPIASPRQTRNALAYVLNNWRHHRENRLGRGGREPALDPFSSALSFDGWIDGTRFAIPDDTHRCRSRRPRPGCCASAGGDTRRSAGARCRRVYEHAATLADLVQRFTSTSARIAVSDSRGRTSSGASSVARDRWSNAGCQFGCSVGFAAWRARPRSSFPSAR